MVNIDLLWRVRRVCCSAALAVQMSSLECSAEDDVLSADELESTAGDLDEPTDTETESVCDGMTTGLTRVTQWSRGWFLVTHWSRVWSPVTCDPSIQ